MVAADAKRAENATVSVNAASGTICKIGVSYTSNKVVNDRFSLLICLYITAEYGRQPVVFILLRVHEYVG